MTRMQPGTPVKVKGTSHCAEIDHWITKDKMYLLDRQAGPYWVYADDELEPLEGEELRQYIIRELKEKQQAENRQTA